METFCTHPPYSYGHRPFHTAGEGRTWVAQQFGVQYTAKGIYSLLKRVDCRPKVPLGRDPLVQYQPRTDILRPSSGMALPAIGRTWSASTRSACCRPCRRLRPRPAIPRGCARTRHAGDPTAGAQFCWPPARRFSGRHRAVLMAVNAQIFVAVDTPHASESSSLCDLSAYRCGRVTETPYLTYILACDRLIPPNVGTRGAAMANEVMRTHVIMPRELVDSVDELVGKGSRSRFFAEAVEEKLARARLVKAAKKVAGSLAGVNMPGWETSESAAEWVHSSRKADDDKRARLWEDK